MATLEFINGVFNGFLLKTSLNTIFNNFENGDFLLNDVFILFLPNVY